MKNIIVCFVVDKAMQQAKWGLLLGDFSLWVLFLKDYLRSESRLERWARVRVACLFHCQALTVPAFHSLRRISGAL